MTLFIFFGVIVICKYLGVLWLQIYLVGSMHAMQVRFISAILQLQPPAAKPILDCATS